jgi:hypothetical protein
MKTNAPLSAIFAALVCLAAASARPSACEAPAPGGGRSAPAPATGCSAIQTGIDGSFNGFVPDPDDAWHRDVSHDPVAINSDDFFETKDDLGSYPLHPDFGSIYGIPYVVADSRTTPLVKPHIKLYLDASDISAAPIPPNAKWEGEGTACTEPKSDQHLLLVDRATCSDYEYYQATVCNGEWSASNVAMFDLLHGEERPFGFTSADASGLSMLEGMVRYDEIVAGHIDHAIRFTAKSTKKIMGGGGSLLVRPANHGAGTSGTTDNIMGMRLRLKANFDISHFSHTNQIILTAMKKYGLILADNGSNMFFQGTRDPRWNDEELHQLTQVHAYDFEVLKMGTVLNSKYALKGAAPDIVSFKASATSVNPGTAVTLTAVMKGASYAYIDQTGFLRNDTVTVHPTQTTRYKLTARNEFGSATGSVVIEVK